VKVKYCTHTKTYMCFTDIHT